VICYFWLTHNSVTVAVNLNHITTLISDYVR